MILIGRGLDFRYDLEPIGKQTNRSSKLNLGGCAVVSVRRYTEPFPVVMTKGSHLFPYRTQKLSPSVPMVLGW